MAVTLTTSLAPSGIRLQQLSRASLRTLIDSPQPPCLSLLMPTHRRPPDNAVDRGTYSGLVDALCDQLAAHGRNHTRHRLTAPLRALEYDPDFWQNTLDGLAVFACDGKADVFRVGKPLAERAVLSDRFCTLPLIPLVSSIEPFDLLALTSRTARIYSGTLDNLEPATLGRTLHGSPRTPGELHRIDIIDEETREPHRVRSSSGVHRWRHGGFHSRQEDIDADTERFFREVDREIFEQVSRQSHHPLFVVALGEHAAVFRHLSKNPFLQCSFARDPSQLGPVELARVVEPLVTTARQQRVEGLLQLYARALKDHRGSGDPAEIQGMAAAGRVAVLLVEAGQDSDLAETITRDVLLQGGDVIALPGILMPNETGLAAIGRY